jgi:hypothetical protein
MRGGGAAWHQPRIALRSIRATARAQEARRGARSGRTEARCRTIPIHHVKQRSLLHSRGAFLRPGFACLFSIHPHEGRAERRKAHYFCCRAVRRDDPRLLRRGARPAGRARLFGAPPWRFSVGGRASISGISSGFVQRAPRSQVVVPGGRGPEPPGADGYEPRPQDATPRPAFRIVSRRRPSMGEDMRYVA